MVLEPLSLDGVRPEDSGFEPGEPSLLVLSANPVLALPVGDASFGAPLTSAGITGDVVVALDAPDAAGPLTTDGCSAIQNDVAGKIALIDRGTCGFVVKVKNAQNAGAKAVLIADNVQSSPPGASAEPTPRSPSPRFGLPSPMRTRSRPACRA